uniref:Uncharacterized protein n=1 Tax=Setaria italica TaxID=4555 RepID=K3ZMM2_SETIT
MKMLFHDCTIQYCNLVCNSYEKTVNKVVRTQDWWFHTNVRASNLQDGKLC